jgi:hypothetical protein
MEEVEQSLSYGFCIYLRTADSMAGIAACLKLRGGDHEHFVIEDCHFCMDSSRFHFLVTGDVF